MDPVALLDALPDPVLVVDDGARLRWASRSAEAAFGWPAEVHVGRTVDHLVHPDDLNTALVSLESVQGKEVGTTVELRLLVHSGAYRTFEVRGAPAAPLGFGGVVMSLRDVTDRYGWEIARGDAAVHHAVLDRSPGVTILLDADLRVRSATRALTTVTGHALESTVGRPVVDLVVEAERPAVSAELELVVADGGTRTFEASLLTRPDGDLVRMSITAVGAVDDAAIGGIVLSAVDITTLDASRTRLRHLATHDGLTGLPNRTLLLERLSAMLSSSVGVHRTGVIYCDVDAFKDVNDALGHAGGDRVLVQVAGRLSEVVRGDDVVGRLAGDEFVILLPDTTAPVLEEITRRIAEAMADPFTVAGVREVGVSVSTGWALGADGTTAHELLERADMRMYGWKRRRRPAEPRST